MFRPQPVSVETARVVRGPLVVTIDEEGRTRVRDRYTVSAPVAGYVTRIVYRVGDQLRRGQVVARILPAPSGPLDRRTRTQLDARAEATADALTQAGARVEAARAALEQAKREALSATRLLRSGSIAPQDADAAETRRRRAESELATAMAGLNVANHDVEAARAALLAAEEVPRAGGTTNVHAPQNGAILKVFEPSERVVAAGTALFDIGDASALEIVADLLSTDAVRVAPGARVLIDRWGGSTVLNGRVRVIEPASFTKVSALGVEEQRVNVLIDIVDPYTVWARLGDGFAVEVRVVQWERPDVVTVPTSALFRHGDQWAVFLVSNGRALMKDVRIDHQNTLTAEVTAGLTENNEVIVHPSERISDGTRVNVR
jgi:HlyD family secretion protein